MQEIWHHFLTWLQIEIAAYGLIALVAIIIVGTTKYLSWHKQDIQYVEAALTMVHDILGSRLGSKADRVFQIWLAGLEAVKSGDFTAQEMVDEFMKFVELAAVKENITLTPVELNTVRKTAEQTLKMSAIKRAPTQQVVKMLLFEQPPIIK